MAAQAGGAGLGSARDPLEVATGARVPARQEEERGDDDVPGAQRGEGLAEERPVEFQAGTLRRFHRRGLQGNHGNTQLGAHGRADAVPDPGRGGRGSAVVDDDDRGSPQPARRHGIADEVGDDRRQRAGPRQAVGKRKFKPAGLGLQPGEVGLMKKGTRRNSRSPAATCARIHGARTWAAPPARAAGGMRWLCFHDTASTGNSAFAPIAAAAALSPACAAGSSEPLSTRSAFIAPRIAVWPVQTTRAGRRTRPPRR
jgi:hypothetical protein